MARFALFTNGVKVETLDELKENFNIKNMLENFRNGSLERWLAENRFSGEVEQVSQIKKDSSDQSVIFRLFTIFSLSDEQIERSNKQEELRLEEERALREKEIREDLQKEAHSEAILTNEDIELFWDDTEMGLPDIKSSGVSDSITFSVMKNQFVSVGGALYYFDDEDLYESKNGINYKGIQEVKTILEESSNEIIRKIQQINEKLFLTVTDNRDIFSDEVDFYVNEGGSSMQEDFNRISNRDFIIESDSNRLAWTAKHTTSGSPAWGITMTETGYAFLNLHATRGYHDQKNRYPLESTQDIEDLQYFKGGYIAIGRWFSLEKEDVYSIYYSPDRETFDPVTPPEAEFHRAGVIQMDVFDNIAFVSAYPEPTGWGDVRSEAKKVQEILPGTKTYYSLDGRSWRLAPIKAHKIFKTDFGFLAYSVDYGISNQSFAYVNNIDGSFSKFEDRQFRGYSDYYIHHLYISVDGIEWREMPLPSGRLKFILPLDNKFLFLSEEFFNTFTGKYHKRQSCFYGKIKRRNGNDGFLKKTDIKFDVINVPGELKYRASKILVSNGQNVRAGEKLLSCKTGLFTRKYLTAPYDCKIQFIVADLSVASFIISKSNVGV